MADLLVIEYPTEAQAEDARRRLLAGRRRLHPAPVERQQNLDAHADELGADRALVCDTNMWHRETPAIAAMLRGTVTEQITIDAADRDLHSGFYGSAAANPNHIVAGIVADLHDAGGRVTVAGFYDGVHDLPEALKRQWAELGFDPKAFLGEIELAVPGGERDRSVLK